MNIVLYSRAQPSFSAEDLDLLINALDETGMSYRMNKDFAGLIGAKTGRTFGAEQIYRDSAGIGDDARVMVSYGGDGTFLDAVRLLDNRPVPIVGINSGRLGFLANITKENMKQAFADIKAGDYTVAPRSLIHAEGEFTQQPGFPYAFNEFTIQRHGPNMISTEVYVNDEMIATYWGRRRVGFHAFRFDGLFAERRRAGGGARLPVFFDFADRAAQPDDALGGDSGQQRDYAEGVEP